nr:hypothetical protein BaRGS_006374 [Batillaria attramentaria]
MQRFIPENTDFLIAHSTLPGYKAFRDPANGSLFIDKLTELIKTLMEKTAHQTLQNFSVVIVAVEPSDARLSDLTSDIVSVIYLSSTMQVYVSTLTGQPFTLTVEESETIRAVKSKIHHQEGTPPSQQRLIYGAKQLKDECTLKDYNIENEATLRLAVRRPAIPYLNVPFRSRIRQTWVESPVWKEFGFFHGELQHRKRSHGGQKKRFKDTLKVSLKAFEISADSWEETTMWTCLDKLKDTFNRLKFDVICHEDVTDEEMLRIVSEAGLKDHSESDCIVICILSHDANEHEVNNEGNEDFELVERERLILIIGKTGTGKSTVVDTIDIDNMKLKYQGRKDEVSRWKTICGGEPDIILLTARCDIPYTAEDYDFYCQMKRLWGDEKEFCSHLVVGFTFDQEKCKWATEPDHSLISFLVASVENYFSGSSRSEPMDESVYFPSAHEAGLEHAGEQMQSENNDDLEDDFEHIDNERVVIIFGKTASGKSSVGNILLNEEKFRVGQPDMSPTDAHSCCSPGACSIKVVDTIDIDNMELTYEGRKDEVSRWKTICGGEPDIILLTARCDIPYTAEDYDFYCQIKRLWGDEKEFCSHLVVGFTFGDRLQFDIAGKTAECPELEQWTVTLATLSQFPMQSRNTPVYSFQLGTYQRDNAEGRKWTAGSKGGNPLQDDCKSKGKGRVFSSNGGLIKIQHLTDRMSGLSSPELAGKPKLFFIQACQGCPVQIDATPDDHVFIPEHTDFLIAHSTLPEFASFRIPQNGSFFVDKLTEVLNNHAHRKIRDKYLRLATIPKTGKEVYILSSWWLDVDAKNARKESEAALMSLGNCPGTFLFRRCTDDSVPAVLSVLYVKPDTDLPAVGHYKLNVDDEGVYLTGLTKFHTIFDLIEHYLQNLNIGLFSESTNSGGTKLGMLIDRQP